MVKKIKYRGLVIPVHPVGFSHCSGIYIPEIYTPEYKSELIRDYGLGAAISFSVLFGNKMPIEEIIKLLRNYGWKSLFHFICAFSNYISINGTREISKDTSQKVFLKEGINKGIALGYKVTYPEEFRLESSNVINPYLIHLLIVVAILMSEEECAGMDVNKDIGFLALAALGLADYSFPYVKDADIQSQDLHYNTIRNAWLQTPFLGTAQTLLARLHRFVTLSNWTLEVMKENNSREAMLLEQCFEKDIGLGVEKFIDVVFAINSIWLGQKEIKTPILNINPVDKPIHSILYKYVSQISKTVADYRSAIKSIIPNMDISGFRLPELILLLTKYPFVDLGNHKYLLLGPHLLLRQIELSLSGTYIDNKISKSLSVFKGPLGKNAERYVQTLARKAVDKNRNCGTEFPHTPDTSEHLCDFLISQEDVSVVFEVKYSEPHFFKSFEDSTAGLAEFKQWFINEFLLEPSKRTDLKTTPGAIYQLKSAADNLFNKGCSLGIKPKRVLPVIVCANSMIFDAPFYKIVDEEIRQKSIFGNDNRILPILVMGIQDLEYLYGINNLSDKGMTFRELLVKKSASESARFTAWPIFIERLNLESKVPKEFIQTRDTLLERSRNLFR